MRTTGEFAGFTGLDPVDEDMPFSGVEAVRRLARTAWGHGYATVVFRLAAQVSWPTVRGVGGRPGPAVRPSQPAAHAV